jgi:hypothetical protein
VALTPEAPRPHPKACPAPGPPAHDPAPGPPGQDPAPLAGRRLGTAALAMTGSAVALMAATAVLGPSAAVVPLPGGAFPVGARLHPSAWVVSGLLAAGIALSVAATVTGWRALQRGWAPSPRRLLAGAVLAIAVLAAVPPVAGADVLSYAAYGHIAARGLDPFTTRPDFLKGDVFARAVEAPWQATPSVYGPLAVWEQEAIVRLAGGRLRLAVGLLDAVNAAAFAAAGALLLVLAGPGEDRRRHAVLAFALNPVLLFAVVAGGHLDALAALAVVAALVGLRRSFLLAGAAGGAAVLVKLTAGLPLAGWAWLARWGRNGSWRRVAALAAGAVAAVAAGYGTAGWHALGQARRASAFVSVGSPWRPVRSLLELVVNDHIASLAVGAGSIALGLWLVAVLNRALPTPTGAGQPGGVGGGDRPAVVAAAARAGLVFALAWTLATPYVLGWYDALAWALLALVPSPRYQRILLAHTATLALAYLPGRVVPLPPVLGGLTTALRSGACPAVLALLVALALLPSRPLPGAGWLHRSATAGGGIMST